MKPYNNYRVYGPYKRKDGRMHVVLVNLNTHKRITVSYAKFLIETSIGKFLDKNHDVHHKDENPLNNSLENLEIIYHSEHARKHAIKYIKDIKVSCTYCGKEVILTPKQQRHRTQNINSGRGTGVFCNRSCSGKYGKKVQIKNKPG
ncbi:MAG: HNH endonuclease [Clostridia bacterium]